MPDYLKNPAAFGADDFKAETDCSSETLDKFKIYARLLQDWTKRINLVADSTLPMLWHRHFLDSAQLFPLVTNLSHRVVDVGSGAGFPGLVLAMLGMPHVTLIERDTRKAAFLRTVLVETGTRAELINMAAAEVKNSFDVVTSRALASVAEILDLTAHMQKPATQYLLLKGKNLDPELVEAHKEWDWQAVKMRSLTDADGVIVKLTDVRKKN